MTAENESKLNCYKDLAILNREHDVRLVQDIRTSNLLVRKHLTHYDRRVYTILAENHFPGIPGIRDIIETGDGLILIEDYISGRSLSQLLKERSFSETETALIIISLCEILRPLHSHDPQIIHRDIKASNLIISETGDLYLVDFDASKIYDPGKDRDTVLIGTEGYAAPEQYGFAQSDRRTDIYAIGILMKKMLEATVLSPSMSAIIDSCTQMDPKYRFDNVDALSRALEQILPGENQIASGQKPGTPPDPYVQPSHNPNDRVPPETLPFYRKITGFKSGRILPAICASLWYIVILIFSFTIKPLNEDGTPMSAPYTWATPLLLFLILTVETFYLGNSFGWRDRFPFKRRRGKNRAADFFYVLFGAVIICLTIFVLSIILIMACGG